MSSASAFVLGLLLSPAVFLPPVRAAVQASEDAPRPVFRADGELVPVGEFGRWLLQVLGDEKAREFAQTWLVEREGRRLGIEVGDDEVTRTIDDEIATRVEGAFLGDRDAWVAELERVGRSEGEYRRAHGLELHQWLVATRIAERGRVVPEDKIRRVWELHYGRNGRRYDLRMLELQVVQEMPPEETPRAELLAQREQKKLDVLAQARDLRARLVAGEDFGDLAAQHSTDEVTRRNRGRLPQGFRHFGWPDVFLDTLEALAPGEISEPVYARGGWWIVRVDDVDVTPLESVRDELTAELIRRGPESDEVAAVQRRLSEGVGIEVEPSLGDAPASDRWPESDEIAMHIDGEPVGRAEYATWLLHSQGGAWYKRFVMDWLVERKARAAGVTVTQADVEKRAREILQWRMDNFPKAKREAFRVYLESIGKSEDEMVHDLLWRSRADLLTERLIQLERTISPESVRLRFEDVYGPGGVGQDVRSMAISVRLPELAPGLDEQAFDGILAQAMEEARKRAESIAARVRDGEDFAALAQKHGDEKSLPGVSAAPSRFRPDTWAPEVASAVQALAPGDVSEPISQGFLWLVFECTGRHQVAFEDVRHEIELELARARPASVEIATYRNVLYEAAGVQVLPAMYE